MTNRSEAVSRLEKNMTEQLYNSIIPMRTNLQDADEI